MAERKRLRREFEELQRRVERLKQVEQELNALDLPAEVFGWDVQSLRAKLKSPRRAEEVERELQKLKERAEEHQRAREREEMKTQIAATAPIMLPELPRYTIVQRIGIGGLADVYEARRDDGATVALKVPRLASFETLNAEEFLKEAELWMKLDHPHIVKPYEYGAKPYPWIAMELMEGGSLRAKVGRLPLHQSLKIGIGVAQALFYAHHHGVVHRDIKPENILFDRQNTPKITDWGLAKALLEESKTFSGFKGTLIYCAPEQVSSSEFGTVDWRTDIYQFGVLLWEMLTGQRPFARMEPGAIVVQILSGEIKPPSQATPGIPEELDGMVARAIARKKGDRYDDISVLQRGLEAVLAKVGEAR